MPWSHEYFETYTHTRSHTLHRKKKSSKNGNEIFFYSFTEITLHINRLKNSTNYAIRDLKWGRNNWIEYNNTFIFAFSAKLMHKLWYFSRKNVKINTSEKNVFTHGNGRTTKQGCKQSVLYAVLNSKTTSRHRVVLCVCIQFNPIVWQTAVVCVLYTEKNYYIYIMNLVIIMYYEFSIQIYFQTFFIHV